MIIDGRGHYTTSPRQHEGWRPQQIEAHTAGKPPPPRPTLTDDEIRETIVAASSRCSASAAPT
jgi:4-oxalmesaconate hydratase